MTSKFWKYLSATIAGLFLLLTVAGFAFVQQFGGFSNLVERQLNAISNGPVVTVSSTGFGIKWSERPLILKVQGIQMEVQESTLLIPAAEFELGFSSLLTGQPEKLVLRGLDLDLVKTVDGWNLPKIIGLTAPLLDDIEKSRVFMSGLAMRKIGIDVASMTLSDTTGDLPQVQFSNIYLDLESLNNGSLTGSVRGQHVPRQGEPGTFTATFTSWSGGKRFAMDITAQKLFLNNIVDYSDFGSTDLRRPGSLSGHIGLIVENSEIAMLDADIALQNGSFGKLDALASTEFTLANVIGTYARSQKALNVSKSNIIMADGRRFSFVGAFNDIGTSLISFAGRMRAGNVSLQSILADWPNAVVPDYKNFLMTHFDSGYIKESNAQIAGQINPSSLALKLSQFDFDGDFYGLRINFATNQYKRAVGTADGSFTMRIGAQGKLNDFKVDASVSDGSVTLADSDKPVIVPIAYLEMEYGDGAIIVDKLMVDFARDGKLLMEAKFEINQQMKINASSAQISTDDFGASLFALLWPAQAAPEIRGWLRQNIPSGRIRDAKILIGTGFDAETKKQKLDYISGNLRLRDSTIRWSEKLPPFKDLSADLAIKNAVFTANVTNAQFGDSNVQHGNLTIFPVVGTETRQMNMSIVMKGTLANAAEYAKKLGVRTLAGMDMSDVVASGEAELILEAAFPLEQKVDALEAIKKLDATISNGSFKNLPSGIFIEDAELVMAFGDETSDISGLASFMGAPVEFNLQLDRENGLVNAVGLASPSSELASVLANRLGMRLDGKLGGKLIYSGDIAKKTGELQLSAPLSGVSIDAPALNWAKLPAEAGRASMVIAIRGGEVAAINDIDIVAGSLVAQGQIAFDKAGAIQAGFFERVAWPGNDIRDLIIESNQDKSWQVGANAKIVDLVPVRRNKGLSGGETVNFDFTADQIVVDNQISLSGQLIGHRSADGIGSADFSGSLLVHGEPLISEAQFSIVFGMGDETITGTGLIGGGETDFNFVDSAQGKPKLVLASKNGGRMLSGLDITDTIRGGDVQLETVFESDDFKSYNTRIDIENFAVVEAPRAVRALSVLSLAGLYALVEGDGTGFKTGLADLETRNAEVNIKSLKASGDAVAVSMLGVYNRATKQVDVSGNLVPASQISNLVGKLPLIGNVFTGVDKSGIFTTQFRVTGRSDDMKTSINPASVAPGVLRDLLSPNWLGKEGDRLFDGDGKSVTKTSPQATTP